MAGKLYIVPTPIGNLEDITLRAIRILKECTLILAEDTRNTRILLKHFDIQKPIKPYHQYNEHKTIEGYIDLLKSGETIALVSDAGTPGISDPGFLLIRHCVEANIDTECLPGASALIPAIVNSGFPCDKFCFEGFLPHKKGRHTRMTELAEETRTLIIYESPHRLVKTLLQLAEYFGKDRNVVVCRELTKIYEENLRGTLDEIYQHYADKNIKGEIVIVIKGKDN